MISIAIIDDHKIVIEGLTLMLLNASNIKLIGSAQTGEKALKLIKHKKPDVVLLDINLPDINGTNLCKILLKENKNTKIIALSMHKESSIIKLMLKNGASGYLLKSVGQDELITAIKDANNGKTYIGEATKEIILNTFQNTNSKKESPFPSLSRREKDVLKLIFDEYTTQEIADKLHIGFGTVETHRRNMMSKLGVRNTAGLVKVTLEYNLLKNK